MANAFETHEQENLDRLCELIMDELKVLSAQGRGLTLSSLHEALSGKTERLKTPGFEAELREIKEVLSRILTGLGSDPGGQFSERSYGIQQKIDKAGSFRTLYLLRNEIADLVEAYRTAVREENRELSSLVIEISVQLIEVETNPASVYWYLRWHLTQSLPLISLTSSPGRPDSLVNRRVCGFCLATMPKSAGWQRV